MPFTKGSPRPEGAGRRKGTKTNKVKAKMNASAKEAFQFAFDDIGGKRKLAMWAKNNEEEFYKLYARLVPVDKTVTGDVSVTFVEDLKS